MNEPKLFLSEVDDNRLWHIPFNRVDDELIVQMVSRRADDYFRYDYAIQGGGYTPPDDAIRYHIKLFTRDPRDAPRQLRALPRLGRHRHPEHRSRRTS